MFTHDAALRRALHSVVRRWCGVPGAAPAILLLSTQGPPHRWLVTALGTVALARVVAPRVAGVMCRDGWYGLRVGGWWRPVMAVATGNGTRIIDVPT